MSTRTCTLLLHTSRVDYSSTLYRDLPRSTERYGADTDSESDAEELTRTCQSQTRIQTHAHMSESDAEERQSLAGESQSLAEESQSLAVSRILSPNF